MYIFLQIFMTFYEFQSMPSYCKHRILEHRIHKAHFQAPSRGARTRSPSLALFYDPSQVLPASRKNISTGHLLWHLSYLWRPATLQQGKIMYLICKNMHVTMYNVHENASENGLSCPIPTPHLLSLLWEFRPGNFELIALVRHDKNNAAWL